MHTRNENLRLPVLVLSALLIKVLSTFILIYYFRHASWAEHLYTDIWGWRDFLQKCTKGQIPYVDFSKEYPVGIGAFFWLVSTFIDGSNGDLLLNFHVIFFSGIDLLNVILIWKILSQNQVRHAEWIALVYLLSPVSLIIAPFRFESMVNVFLLAGMLCQQRQRSCLSALMLGIGAAIKVYPLIFFAVQLYKDFSEKKCRAPLIAQALVFFSTIALINLPFVILSLCSSGQYHNWLDTFMFHVNRPLYWDTPFGVLCLWYGYLPMEQWASLFSLGVMAALFLIAPRMDPLIKTALIIFASLVCNRVYSPQFHLWFLPLLLLSLPQHKEGRVYCIFLLVLLELVSIVVYPFSFAQTYDQLSGFDHGKAYFLGQFATWVCSSAVLIRALILVELIFCNMRNYLKTQGTPRTTTTIGYLRATVLAVLVLAVMPVVLQTYHRAALRVQTVEALKQGFSSAP